MKKTRYTEEQIIGAIKQHEAGANHLEQQALHRLQRRQCPYESAGPATVTAPC